MTISEQLVELAYIKEDIKYAIIDGGGTVSDDDAFSTYADKISDLLPNPKKEYLTFTARESGVIGFHYEYSLSSTIGRYIEYSIDGGSTWTRLNNVTNQSSSITVNVSEGDTVMWRGDNDALAIYESEENELCGYSCGSYFYSTCEFDARGNIMSLLYKDDFINKKTLETDRSFSNLFYPIYSEETVCKIVNSKDLCLPATILSEACYANMFYNCESLITAPRLPARNLENDCYAGMFQNTRITEPPVLRALVLADYCYECMFYNCTSLTKAPQLPAVTLSSSCYYSMFSGCSSLVTMPKLPATTLSSSCYFSMFYGCTKLTSVSELPSKTLSRGCYYDMFRNCTSLTTPPELPATTLAEYCYCSMFQGCTSLTTAPALPATTLTNNCYRSMFSGCTSLTTAPQLSATTLANYCCQYMFYGCKKLTTAPVLSATTLVAYCYGHMFQGCSKLNYIKAMFTTTPSGSSPNYYTIEWVSGVASTGTFVKNSAATWSNTGDDSIPRKWTVQTASL